MDRPQKILYRRFREASAEILINDQELIDEIVKCLEVIKAGAVSELAYEDYTDILVLYFEDEKKVYEFEANAQVIDGVRYQVTEGLKELRTILNRLIPE